jgi:CBS domain containing-hemolysin-like protein
VVVDEHGGTAGIVTFEDLIEEIVGPIRDEYDTGEVEELQIVSDNEVVVSARFPVDDLKEALNLEVPNVEADTVGGLVYEELGEIPKVGATIQLGSATLTVEAVRRQSIQTVRITSPVPLIRDRAARPADRDGHQEAWDTQEESPAHARRQ